MQAGIRVFEGSWESIAELTPRDGKEKKRVICT
jgi:hypothetical protein